MISPAAPSFSNPSPLRTVWGLDPVQLHARYWAAYGVQVVRVGEPSEVVRHAELYLLVDPRSLPMFRLSELMETLNWVEPTVLVLRLRDTRERGYREHVVTEADGRFVRFRREYESSDERLARAALTPDREIAKLWQQAGDPLAGWRRIRRFVPRDERATAKLHARVYDRTDDAEIAQMLHDLVRDWRRPEATIPRAKAVLLPDGGRSGAWRDPTADSGGANLIGPVWIGAGRRLGDEDTVVGPAVMWDEPIHRPAGQEIQDIEWLSIDPGEPPEEPVPARPNNSQQAAKRAFDVVFSLFALLATAPLWPVILGLIWWADGRPFFFGHVRQSKGGRPFRCWKFRSMFNNAEEIKKNLIAEGKNEADGAQFFMENDPRITRIGRLLRKTNLDELPQFYNVLRGEMSVVGPRPSPDKENQFAPAWREARLSVKPGITGLWQLRRTRNAGSDFQEWIRYDIEYVENQSLWLDAIIIYKTLAMILRKLLRS